MGDAERRPRRCARRAETRLAQSRHDESQVRISAQERRALQRRGEAHGIFRCRALARRRYVAHGDLRRRGREILAAAVHRHDAVQETSGRERVGSDAMLGNLVARVALVLAVATPVFVQTELAGSWAARNHEDGLERGGGPYAVDYTGLPLNDEARARALSYSADQLG